MHFKHYFVFIVSLITTGFYLPVARASSCGSLFKRTEKVLHTANRLSHLYEQHHGHLDFLSEQGIGPLFSFIRDDLLPNDVAGILPLTDGDFLVVYDPDHLKILWSGEVTLTDQENKRTAPATFAGHILSPETESQHAIGYLLPSLLTRADWDAAVKFKLPVMLVRKKSGIH